MYKHSIQYIVAKDMHLINVPRDVFVHKGNVVATIYVLYVRGMYLGLHIFYSYKVNELNMT